MKKEESKKFFIEEFQLNKYTGKWFEIARIENSFEEGMHSVTAEYVPDGRKIRVINRGFIKKKNRWKDAKGVAVVKYPEVENILRVSFFRPFYADYIVLDYDRKNYSWSIVISSSKDYLWILSRSPEMELPLYEKLVDTAVQKGFQRSRILKISQEKNIDKDR